MAQMAAFLWLEEVDYEPKAAEKYLTGASRPILERFLEDFSRLETLKEGEQRAFIEAIAKAFDKKIVDIVQPVRVALSGREVTPGIFEVIEILGRQKVEKRIAKAIASIT
jgi:glutamyl-tRNA synthetase